MHAPNEDKWDNRKERFYEVLQCVFDQLELEKKILLSEFNTKVAREHIC
jgi:hypothetical protein